MPRVLTTNATIMCPHGGKGTTMVTTPYADAQGLVAAEGDPGTLSCVFTVPCVGYTLASMGLNASYIAGRRVILETDFQKSFTGLPLTISETTNLIDESTPAPLPAGATSAPLAPELLDLAPPVVTAAPSAVTFVSTATPPTPAMAVVVFSLASAYPLSWSLTLLNTVAGTSVDATNGLPSGLVVTPAGGSWTSPTLVVTATLSAAFMASLGPNPVPHELYMTGVSKRGKPASACFRITVT